MTEIQVYSDGIAVSTNSKNVADVFNKQHRHVLRDIEKLDCSQDFRESNFGLSSYTSEQNKSLPCIEMTKDGFTFLCMGYRGEKAAKFKEAYIAEFNRMAKSLTSISDRCNILEVDRRATESKGKDWAEIGHEIRRQKKIHKEKEKELLSDVQLKISFGES